MRCSFLIRAPWIDWARLTDAVRTARRLNQKTRSSKYYYVTLRQIKQQNRHKLTVKPTSAVHRDALTCQLAAWDALPRAVCDLYDAAPSRDLWKAMLTEWLRTAKSKCSGVLGHYYMKSCLDRLFSVRSIHQGSISWWPTDCPSYLCRHELLYPKVSTRARFSEDDKFQTLCAIHRALHAAKPPTTFTNLLAQTCSKMEGD